MFELFKTLTLKFQVHDLDIKVVGKEGSITIYHIPNINYHIRSNYRTYPYKRRVKKFCSLQITASALFLYFFIKAYVVGTHMNCINLLMQF